MTTHPPRWSPRTIWPPETPPTRLPSLSVVYMSFFTSRDKILIATHDASISTRSGDPSQGTKTNNCMRYPQVFITLSLSLSITIRSRNMQVVVLVICTGALTVLVISKPSDWCVLFFCSPPSQVRCLLSYQQGHVPNRYPRSARKKSGR